MITQEHRDSRLQQKGDKVAIKDSRTRNHAESPAGRVTEALAGANYPNVHKLANVAGFEEALELMSKGYWACGQYALEDGKTEYWKGVQDGLNAFFEAVGAAVLNVKELEKRARAKRDQDVPDKDDEDALRDDVPTMTLGGSFL